MAAFGPSLLPNARPHIVNAGLNRLGEEVTNNQQLLWTQRVDKELARVATGGRAAFACRSAMMKESVPMKFKPGQIGQEDFDATKRAEGFDAEKSGFPRLNQGSAAKDFHKCMDILRSEPQHHNVFPETAAQEMAWPLLPHRGSPAYRLRGAPRTQRMGLGWNYDPLRPSSLAPSAPPGALAFAAAPRPVGPAAGIGAPMWPSGGGAGRASSSLSASAPSLPQPPSSCLSASGPPPPGDGPEGGEAPLPRAGASRLSAAAPSALSAAALAPSALSRSSSLPPGLLKADPAQWLQRREEKFAKAMQKVNLYGVHGERGSKWNRPNGETDVTSFNSAFLTATGGVPLHKFFDR